MSKRADKLKGRLAAIGYGVEEQNSSQQAIGPGTRDVTTKVEGSNNPGKDGVAEQDGTQQEIHNQGKKNADKTYKESEGEMSHSSY
jgi:hypothetical protein